MQKLKEEVRQKIIKAGKIRFKKDGFEKTSMKDIATDAGISIGNIYRYFFTKKHILNEILHEVEAEIETFFENIPQTYSEKKIHDIFENICDLTVKIAEENNDTLKIMFNSQSETQYIEFKEKLLHLFTEKIISMLKNAYPSKEINFILSESIARAQLEGFTYIVKNSIDDLTALKKNLEIYGKLMIENLDKRVMEVIGR